MKLSQLTFDISLEENKLITWNKIIETKKFRKGKYLKYELNTPLLKVWIWPLKSTMPLQDFKQNTICATKITAINS